jgi:hypothetical protein
MVVGPGLHAYHIVSQAQYDLYPLKDEDGNDEDKRISIELSWRRL